MDAVHEGITNCSNETDYIQISKEMILQFEQKGSLKLCEFLDLYCMVCCFLPFQINSM